MTEEDTKKVRGYQLKKGCFLLALIVTIFASMMIAAFFQPFPILDDAPITEGKQLLELRENGITTDGCVTRLLGYAMSHYAIYEFHTSSGISYQGRIKTYGNDELLAVDTCHRIVYLPDDPNVNSAEFIVNHFDFDAFQRNNMQRGLYIWGILSTIAVIYLIVIYILSLLTRNKQQKSGKPNI